MDKMTRKQLAALSAQELIARQQELTSQMQQVNWRTEPDVSAKYDAMKRMQLEIVHEANRRMDSVLHVMQPHQRVRRGPRSR